MIYIKKEAKYVKRNNTYVIYYKDNNNKKRSIQYSVKLFGDYAKELCEKSYIDGVRYKNYIIEKDDYAIIKIYSESNGYFDVFIDLEDIDKIQKYKWGINIDRRKDLNRIVARSFDVGLIHRYIMNLSPEDKRMIDHIDRNPLNNRKENLRVVTNQINQQNVGLSKNNTSGIVGVRLENKHFHCWIAKITNNNGIRESKTYSIKKYGEKAAKEKAIAWRKMKEKEYGYLT